VAGSLALRPGDNVVTDDLDYPSNQVIWHQFCADGGATNRIVASRPAGRGATRGAAALADFAPLVDSRTRAISVAYVSHRNGYRHDLRGLAELAHAHGAILHVDASQAAGALQLDVAAEGIDTLTCGAGKWLLGPLGLAFFYAREALQPRLQSPLHGWMQVETYADPAHLLPGHLYRSARKFEAATVHFQGLYGWRASLRYLQNIGLATIEEHVLGLSARLWHGLAGLGVELLTPPGAASSIVSCRPPDLAALGRALERESIVASVRDDDIRFSPHFFNTAAEIDHVLAVVGRALPR
jgi:cysteine desulfurase / selenocysteine lyase